MTESAENTQPAAPTNDRNLALLTHLSGLIFGFLVPLIVFLVTKSDSNRTELIREAKEALNFQISIAIYFIASWFLVFLIIGAILMPLVWLFNVIFCIIAAIKVSSSGAYRYPLTIRLIK